MAPRWHGLRAHLVDGALLAVLLGITGWVLDGVVAGILGGRSLPSALPVLLLAGALGAVLGASRIPTWVVHLTGAVAGIGLLIARSWALGGSQAGEGTAPTALAIVGAAAWAVGDLAGFELFRRGRPVGPVVTLGTTLAVLATSGRPVPGFPDPLAAIFAAAALLLLLRADLAERRRAWVRRRFLVPSTVERGMLRAGAAVGGLAIILAAALAGVVSVPRVELVSLPGSIGVGGGVGTTVASVVRDRVPVGDAWVTSDAPVLAVRPADGLGRYLARDRHAVFDGRAWTAGDGTDTIVDLPAGAIVPDPDRPLGDDPGSRRVGVAVTNLGAPLAALLAPAGLWSVDRPLDIHLRDRDGPAYGIAFRSVVGTGASWTMTVDEPAGERLPDDVAFQRMPQPAWLERYRGPVAAAVLDARARTMAATFRDGHPDADALHVAARMEAWFAGTDRPAGATPRFRYATSIRGVCGPGQGVVACLLETRVGFCQQYATAMTLMLQSLGIPARYVEGFLPGSAAPDGVWTVPASAAHAWVEVHAAGMGWVRFDPTPGGGRNGQVTTGDRLGLVAGTPARDPEAQPTTAQSRSRPTPTPEPGTATTSPFDEPTDLRGPVVATLLLALLLAAAIAGGWWRRRTSRQDALPGRDPRALYRALVAQASGVGLGPSAGQTELEFATALGAALPDAAEHVLLLARATVESTYGQRDPDAAALDRMADAFRVARRSLGRARRHPRR